MSHSEHHAEDHAHKEAPQKQTRPQTETKPAVDTAPTIRSAESHVHGGAMLSIVSENNEIAIEFETPIYNLLGFEYAPRTQAEKELVSEVEKTLAAPQSLIRFNNEAKCAFQTPSADVELFDDHHDDEHDDDHDEDHDEHEEDGSHKDVILNYGLTCQNIDKLTSVHVKFFDVFSNFTELELVYLGPSQQMSAKLSSSRPNVDLTR